MGMLQKFHKNFQFNLVNSFVNSNPYHFGLSLSDFHRSNISIETISLENGKMKTRKSASKRFKITGTGKLVRRQCGKQHLNEKRRSRKNSLSNYKDVSESDQSNVSRCLPYKLK